MNNLPTNKKGNSGFFTGDVTISGDLIVKEKNIIKELDKKENKKDKK